MADRPFAQCWQRIQCALWRSVRLGIGLLGGRGLELTPGATGVPTVYEQGNVISELLIGDHKVPFAQAPKGVYLVADEEAALSDRAQKLVGAIELALPNILGLTNQLYAVLTNTAQLTASANQVVASAQPLVTNLTVITTNLRDPHGADTNTGFDRLADAEAVRQLIVF